ncbi:glucosyltransferase domain-containing protein [Eubacterium aggregans]|uniref:glucosyltransferase domain-containing protein n=1 Tax=Eubacterium aggregans TaxID=81409 RepID=UPI003F3A88A4
MTNYRSFINSILEFKAFIEKNLKLVSFNIFIVTIVFGSHIFSTNISIDTDIFIVYPETLYNWLDIGRWGLILTQKIFNMMWFNPYIECVMAFIAIVFFQLIFCFFFYKVNRRYKHLNYYLFSALFITHPIFVLQWFFKVQAFEIAFSIILIAISLIMVFEWIEEKNCISLLIGLLCMVWSFSCYQTNVILFICGALTGFYLRDFDNIKEQIIVSGKLMCSFFIAFLCNEAINRIFFMHGDYISDSILWGKIPFVECARNIWHHMKEVLFSSQIMSFAYIVVCVFLIIMFINELKKMKVAGFYNYLVLSLLMVTTFFLTIYMGKIPLYRSQYMLPFVIGVGFMIAFNSNLNLKWKSSQKWVKAIITFLCVLFVIQQAQISLRLWYTDDIRYEHDVAMLHEIVSTIHQEGLNEKEYPVVFIGAWQGNLNGASYGETEMMGISYFTMLNEAEPRYYHSTAGVARLAKANGYTFKGATQEEVIKAKEYAKYMTAYPGNDYIELKDEIIIVKLSNDIAY